MQAEISVNSLVRIVQSVFTTMMNLEVVQVDAPIRPGDERLTSFVHLTGGWNGAVLVECGSRQACRFAGRFLSLDPPRSVDDDVRDVLGELANMIGGNMKAVMPVAVRLSMPTVMEGHFDLHICGSQLAERLSFESADGNFWVTVLTTKH
jgi:chemotaxis protein CheX